MMTFIACILAFLHLAPISSAALTPPLSTWPLCKSSFAYDVVQGRDGVHPQLDGCFKIREPGHPSLRYGALYFDDTTSDSYVDIHIEAVPLMESFAFTLQLNSELLTSAIIHYKSDDISLGGISDIQARLYNGRVSVNLAGVGYVSYTDYMTTNAWTSFAFSYDFSSGNIYMYRDNEQVASETKTANVKLNLPGVLRLGNPQVAFKDQYTGMMTCLSLYNTATGFDTDLADVLSHCNTSWSSPPPVVPTCFAEEPIRLWPLDDTTYGIETKTSSQPLNAKQCFRYYNPHTNLSNNAIMFDGSVYSLVETMLPVYSLQKDFSIAALLYFEDEPTGNIWTITSSQSSGITGIKLSISDWKLKVEIYSGESTCADLEVDKILLPRTWYPVSVQRVEVSKLLSVIIMQTKYHILDTCTILSSDDNTSAKFTIGGTSNNPENFRGQIRCLGLFASWLDPSRVEERLLSACSEVKSVANPCELTPKVKNVLFTLYRSDVVPDLNVSPITEIETSFFSVCSSHCVSTPFCRSVNYDGGSKCILYDFVTTSCFDDQAGIDYYIAH